MREMVLVPTKAPADAILPGRCGFGTHWEPLLLPGKLVACVGHGADDGATRRIDLDLAAEAIDDVLEGGAVDLSEISPDPLDEDFV